MHSIERKFKKAMSLLASPKDRILIAVSGGPDSVVLLHLLNKYKLESPNCTIAIAHLNHLTRGVDSNKDSDFVVKLGRDLEIETFTEDVDVALLSRQKKASFQESARIIRYEFFERILAKWQGDLIALGHNSDDQAETFVMNLLRGSGLKGLTGIRSRRDAFIRPLRDCSRSEIEEYILVKGLQSRFDKSNQEKCYLRNKIRLDLIPTLELYNPNIKSSLVSTSRLLADDDDYMEKQVKAAMSEVGFIINDNNLVSLNLNLFNLQHPALQKRLVRKAILSVKGNLRSISTRHVLNLIQIMKRDDGAKKMHLPDHLTAFCENGELIICKGDHCDYVENESLFNNVMLKHINIPGSTDIGFLGLCLSIKLVSKDAIDFSFTNSNKAYLDYDKTGTDLKVRVFRPGDRFIPLGMKGTKKLKSFFIDEKIPQRKRKSIPLLTSKNDDIIWVYKKRIGERYRVTDKTSNILLIEGITTNNLIKNH